MKIIKINNKEYKLEFGFDSAECGELIQKMFEIKSGTHVLRSAQKGNTIAVATLDGTSEMLSIIPKICALGFYAGMIEHNAVTEDEAKTLLRIYMKENKKSFTDVYNEIIYPCMEDDGFFFLSGIEKMITDMNQAIEQVTDMDVQQQEK